MGSFDSSENIADPFVPAGLSVDFFVGRAATPDEVAVLAASGFGAIIDNQPDEEKGSGTTSDEMRMIAGRSKLAYLYLPVAGRNPTEAEVREFEDRLPTLPKPVYAGCRTGGRGAALWALASARTLDCKQIMDACADAGFDLRWLEPKIEMRIESFEDD